MGIPNDYNNIWDTLKAQREELAVLNLFTQNLEIKNAHLQTELTAMTKANDRNYSLLLASELALKEAREALISSADRGCQADLDGCCEEFLKPEAFCFACKCQAALDAIPLTPHADAVMDVERAATTVLNRTRYDQEIYAYRLYPATHEDLRLAVERLQAARCKGQEGGGAV